jgi:hypothetical protein
MEPMAPSGPSDERRHRVGSKRNLAWDLTENHGKNGNSDVIRLFSGKLAGTFQSTQLMVKKIQ